jgi:hypothetical protein
VGGRRHSLEHLPAIAESLAAGELSIDKVVELTRFATPDDEWCLIAWAKRVSCGAIVTGPTAPRGLCGKRPLR